ncbi:MAG: hypothetical protein WBB01_20125 [Phormidesmis sp.]
MKFISKGYGFVIFLIFVFVSILFGGYCTVWVFVPWLDRFMFDTGMAVFWFVGFLVCGAVGWLTTAGDGHTQKPGCGALIFWLSFIGTLTTLVIGPIVMIVMIFLLLWHSLTACASGRYWTKLELPQYRKTLYQRPEDCSGGVQSGREIYVGKDGSPWLRPLLISKSGDHKSFDVQIDDGVVRIAGWSGGTGEDSFRTTIYYNLKTGETEGFPIKRGSENYGTEF